ncbi:MAG: hypothetical protein NXI31_10250 [bacterium]|nr:hypothetical protein [bacterium]
MTDDQERPRSSKPKGSNRLGYGLCLGTGVGVALGVTLDNIAMGIAIGVGVGVALGGVATAENGHSGDEGGDAD